jgi:hypothetical protein
MPVLDIEGRKVKVDDSFLSMSPDEQHAKVDDIAKKLKLQPSGGGQTPGMAEGMGRAFARGAPILGGALNKADAAFNAALAPVIDPLLPDSMQKLPEDTFGGRYEHALGIQEGKDKSFQEEHPIADAVSEMAGGIASTGGLAKTAAGAKVLGLGGKTLPQMMTQGAVSGGIINAADAEVRGDNPLTAGIVGAGIGGVAPAAGRLINAASAPVQNTFRALRDPELEGERVVASGLDRDMKAGDVGVTPQEFVDAKASGQPVSLIDAGGTTTRAIARSAANNSPEGRGEMNRMIDARFESQAPRLADWLRQTFHYPDAAAQQEAIDHVERVVNRTNYAKAMKDGDRDIMSPELDRLMGSPALVDAMRKASISGKDRAITQGIGAMRQGVTVENGLVKFTPGKSGAPTYPNLAFWDATKKELDDATSAAMRAGRREEAGTLTQLTRTLRSELDRMVPSYQTARAGAASFFGAENAIEAGQNFVGASQKFGIPAVRRQLSRMSPQERQMFQDGYVSRLVETIEKTGDRRTILNKIQNSPAAREEINVALGPQRAKEIEGRLRVEGVMDLARPALQGNSTTARQLVELGLAGGVGGYEQLQGDPEALMKAALVYGAARGHRVVDERVARHVARLLVSNDVKQLQRGITLLSRNQNMMGSIRNADAAIGAIAARGALPGATQAVTGPYRGPNLGPVQGPQQ